MTDFFYRPMSSAPAATTSTESTSDTIKVRLTKPTEISHYQVSEEQLNMLQGQKRDLLFEAMFLTVGAAIGSFAPAVSAVATAYFGETPTGLGALDAINLMVFVAAVSASAACAIMACTRGKKHEDIIAKIRNPGGSGIGQ